jgi:enoyl-CoA hydratase/carnithine racemase
MSEELVLCEIKDGVAELTLNRPDRMNAWTWDMGLQLHELIRKCGEDDAVRAIIVTGAGRAFCAGADLQRGASTFSGEGRDAQPEQARRARVNPWDIPKPIIAAINGPAVGVGLTTPLQYDIRVAAKDAKLGFVFVQRGVMPELASTWILPRLIGVARACDLLLSGRIFLGEEAAQIGVVNEAVAREEVLPRAREIAAYIAAKAAPVSVAVTKKMIWDHLRIADPELAMQREGKVFYQLGRGVDSKEGVMAFVQKRQAQWSLGPTTDMPDLPPLE